MQMAPPTPPRQPASLPVLVISVLHRLLPPFQSLCQAKGRTTLTGAPPPHPGAAAGQGAGGSGKAQRRWLPLPPLPHPAVAPPPSSALRTDGGRSRRGVCDGGDCIWSPMLKGPCPLPGTTGGVTPHRSPGIPMRVGEAVHRTWGHGPRGAARFKRPPQNRGESCRPLGTHGGVGVGEQPFAQVCCLPKGWSGGGGREPAAAGLTSAAQRG